MTEKPSTEGDGAPEIPFSENVRKVDLAGRPIYVIGTAHISARSADEVAQLIETVRPDCVCVELDSARHQALTQPDAWREMDLFQVVRQKRATMLLAHLILASFQRRLGDRLGIKPGAEMLRAIEKAEEVGAQLVLADRDIQITLRRTWGSLGWWDKMRLVYHLMLTLVANPAISEEEIENLKNQDVLSQVMESFAHAFPRAKRTLIDERDQYMAHKIRTAPGKTVVAVVGAGHLKGILERLAEDSRDEDLAPLMVIPRKRWFTRVFQWSVPALVLGLIGYGFFQADAEVSWDMIKIWFLANGLLSALGAALALAHPFTILAALLAAPLTSLNPMVAAGWVAGLVEAITHKPRVRDFETLATDITSLRGFWGNGVIRILLVVALANLGSTLGTFISIPLMTALLE
ncbi:MAG: TraB/GumN family protein [SAR324 cluster bacterium]|nr:TraB/GumN family protein [SAR324 cluster bacterium]